MWNHAHLEYYQIVLETGLIGLGLLLWCLFDYFKRVFVILDGTTMKLASIFFGFCILGLFSFPAHIWLLASMGMIGYSWFYVIENEVFYGYKDTERITG
jgi:O-antigen ligase